MPEDPKDVRAYWEQQLREAEAELDAARTPSTLNAAAKKLQRARVRLKQLQEEERAHPEQ